MALLPLPWSFDMAGTEVLGVVLSARKATVAAAEAPCAPSPQTCVPGGFFQMMTWQRVVS